MNNVLLAIGALLIAALAALFAVPYAVDWNGYRGVFEEEASRILGRDVRVGGKVDVRLLPVPYVSFGKLRVADTANETGEPLFRADSFTMWLSLPPLLRGVLEARAVELKKPALRLVVDPEKGGNWATQGTGAGTGSIPFLPQAVALQSVRVTNGTVTVLRANSAVLAELTGIDGELEAEALEGPFRFKGNAHWNGAAREVRLATAKMDADGSLRFKTTVRVADTANAYVLEGRISNLKNRPRLDGEITGKIALPAVAAAAPGAKAQPAAERPLADMRAEVEADGTGFKLKNVALSLDNIGQPQLVSGEAQMSWVARQALGLRLGSKLLDLDRISGAHDDASALATARSLVSALVAALPADTDVSLFFAVDQATLGKQNVSAVSMLLEAIDGKLALKDLKAGVPGGGRLDAYGAFTTDAAHAFAGQVALRGLSLQRFLDWAAKGSAPRTDGPFLLQGKLDLADAAVSLTDASAEIGGAALTGEVRYTSGERDKLALTLDGRRVDTGQLWALAGRARDTADPFHDLLPRGLLTGAAVVAMPEAAPAAAGNAPAPRRAPDFAALDVALRVRAGELVAGDLTLKNVDADIAVEREKLTLTSLKGTTADGLGLEIEGDVASFVKNPRGTLRWVVAAPNEPAFSALQRLAGIDLQEAAGKRLSAALAPVRLAGSTRLGANDGKATLVVFDGETRTGRLDGRLRIGGDRQAWRAAPLDLTLGLEFDDAAGLLQALVPGAARDAKSAPRRPGRIDIKSAGQAESGLKTLVSVSADALSATFDGRITAPASGPPGGNGRLALDMADTRLPVALIGLALGSGTRTVPVKGEGDLSVTADAVSFTARRLGLGATRIDGNIAVTPGPDKTRKLTADIDVDTASVATLLALVSDAAPGEAQAAADGVARAGWPAAPFDFAVLDGIDGTIKARFGLLAVQPGVTLANAELETRLEPRRITVTKLAGEALQGRVMSRLAIERQPATVAVKGDIDFTGIKLDALTAVEETRRARGLADVRLDVSAEGLTPASLVAAAKGKGEVRLVDAEISGFAPDTVTSVAEAVLAGKAEREGEGLTRALREAFGQGALKIGGRKLAVEIVDGAARLAPLAVETEQGRTTLLATADLGQMKVDGEWRIEPRTPPPAAGAAATARGALPAVSMIYVGSLGNMGAIEPRLSSGALERELGVRRMEREVEELERVRKADEERARAAEEERKRQEAERLKAQQQSDAAAGANAQTPPAPAPAWSGSTSVTPSPGGGGAAEGAGGVSGAASSMPAEPAPPAAADAAQPKEAAKSERASPPRPKPAPRPRQDSQNNLYKQWN